VVHSRILRGFKKRARIFKVGEEEQAITLLEKLMTMPNGPTQLWLKEWILDPLRNNPRFQKLVNGTPPKIEYQWRDVTLRKIACRFSIGLALSAPGENLRGFRQLPAVIYSV
jgi:hypothetical protein